MSARKLSTAEQSGAKDSLVMSEGRAGDGFPVASGGASNTAPTEISCDD